MASKRKRVFLQIITVLIVIVHSPIKGSRHLNVAMRLYFGTPKPLTARICLGYNQPLTWL